MEPMLTTNSFVEYIRGIARAREGHEVPSSYLAAALYGLFLREDVDTRIVASRYMDAIAMTEADKNALRATKIASAESKVLALAEANKPAADWGDDSCVLPLSAPPSSDIDWERIKKDIAPPYEELKLTTEIGYPSAIEDYYTAEDARYLSNERKNLAFDIFKECFAKDGQWTQGPALAQIIRTYAQGAPTAAPRLEPTDLNKPRAQNSNNRAFFSKPGF